MPTDGRQNGASGWVKTGAERGGRRPRQGTPPGETAARCPPRAPARWARLKTVSAGPPIRHTGGAKMDGSSPDGRAVLRTPVHRILRGTPLRQREQAALRELDERAGEDAHHQGRQSAE